MQSSLNFYTDDLHQGNLCKVGGSIFLSALHVKWLCSAYLKYFQGLRAQSLHYGCS